MVAVFVILYLIGIVVAYGLLKKEKYFTGKSEPFLTIGSMLSWVTVLLLKCCRS